MMIDEHMKQRDKYPGCAIGYDGLGAIDHIGDIRGHYVTMMWKDTRVKVLQHYKSVSYKRSFFEDDFFNDFVGKTSSDDILVSAYMGKRGIHKIVPLYELDNPPRDVKEWQLKLTKGSFPMLGHIKVDGQQGTQDPNSIKKYGERFHRPTEFHQYLEQ